MSPDREDLILRTMDETKTELLHLRESVHELRDKMDARLVRSDVAIEGLKARIEGHDREMKEVKDERYGQIMNAVQNDQRTQERFLGVDTRIGTIEQNVASREAVDRAIRIARNSLIANLCAIVGMALGILALVLKRG